MNFIYKILLTINATMWMPVVYAIKVGTTVGEIPQIIFDVLLLCIPIILSLISIGVSSFLSFDVQNRKCQEFSLADNEFLPTYLGYFFVSLSIENKTTMILLYIIVFVFTFLSQTQYFNPIFLLFGYHYYNILTESGTRIFVIARGKVIRNKEKISFDNLRRINNTTYIQKG